MRKILFDLSCLVVWVFLAWMFRLCTAFNASKYGTLIFNLSIPALFAGWLGALGMVMFGTLLGVIFALLGGLGGLAVLQNLVTGNNIK